MEYCKVLGFIIIGILLFFAVTLDGTQMQVFFHLDYLLFLLSISFIVTGLSFGYSNTVLAVLKGISNFNLTKLKTFKAHLQDVASQCIEIAKVTRKNGMLAAENIEIKNSWLKGGVEYLIDGFEFSKAKELLKANFKAKYSSINIYINVLNNFSIVLPTIGLLLAIVIIIKSLVGTYSVQYGLVLSFNVLLYSLALSQLLFIPLAKRLKSKLNKAELELDLVLSAIEELKKGISHSIVEQALENYINTKV